MENITNITDFDIFIANNFRDEGEQYVRLFTNTGNSMFESLNGMPGINDITETNDSNDDCKKTLSSVLTNLINREVLEANTERSEGFQNFVISIFEDILGKYRKMRNINETNLFFVYKGGSVLSMIFSEYIDKLPQNFSENKEFFTELGKFNSLFLKSDSDYSIYINPQVNNYDTVFYECNILTCLCLNQIRRILLENKARIFGNENYGLNDALLHRAMSELNRTIISSPECRNKYLIEQDSGRIQCEIQRINIGNLNVKANLKQELKEVGMFQKDSSSFDRVDDTGSSFDRVETSGSFEQVDVVRNVSKRSDFIIFYKRYPDLKSVYDMEHTNNDIYMSINETLKFSMSSFVLHRLKLNFDCYCQNNSLIKMNSELVDVSIPRATDRSLIHVLTHLDIFFDKIQITTNLAYNRYSIEGMVFDLFYVVYLQAKPWENAKIAKRIGRFFVMLLFAIHKNIFTDSNNQTPDAKLSDLKTIFLGMKNILLGNGSHEDINHWISENDSNTSAESARSGAVIGSASASLPNSKVKLASLLSIILDQLIYFQRNVVVTVPDEEIYENFKKGIISTDENGEFRKVISDIESLSSVVEKITISSSSLPFEFPTRFGLWGGKYNYKKEYIKYRNKYNRI
jgi:hypothetical protein